MAGLSPKIADRTPPRRLDLLAKFALATFAIVISIRIGVLSPEAQIQFDFELAELIFLGMLLVLLARRALFTTSTSDRIFTSILIAGFVAWFFVSLSRAANPDWSATSVLLFRDILIMVHSAAIAIAIELRLDIANDKSWIKRRSLHAIAAIMLIYTMFGYFTVVPIYVLSESYTTPYALYAAIDLFLALRFFAAASQTDDHRWRGIFMQYGTVFFLINVGDLVGFAYREGHLEYTPDSLTSLSWFLWYPVAYVVAGLKVTNWKPLSRAGRNNYSRPTTSGLFIFGLGLPFIHVVGYGLSLFNPGLREARDVVVAAWIILITLVISGTYYFIERRIAKLDRERTIAEDKARKLENQLEREVRLRSLGRLSAGLAHDFGNSLFAISTHAKAIANSCDSGVTPHKQVKGLMHAIQYAQELVTKLSLVGAAGTTVNGESFDVKTEIAKNMQVIKPSLGSNVKLNYHEGTAPISIRAERSMIQQVLTNYIYNAVDAMQMQGQVDVSIDAYPVRTHCASCGEVVSGGFAVLTVKDDGPGIDPAVRDNIFEPLVTTKPLGKGSGLGLAMIHAIMHRIGGHVGLRSEPQKGTSFIAYFPL